MDYSQESIDSDTYDFSERQSSDLMMEDLTINDEFDNVGRGSCSRNVDHHPKRSGNDFNHQAAGGGGPIDKRSLRPKSARYGCRPGSMLAVHEASIDGIEAMSKTQTDVVKRPLRKCVADPVTAATSPTSSSASTTTSGSSPTAGFGDVRCMATEYVDDVVHASGHVTSRPHSSRKTSPDAGSGYHTKKAVSTSSVATGTRMRNGIPPVARQGVRPGMQSGYDHHQYGHQYQREPREELDDSGEDMVLYTQRQEEADHRLLYETVLNVTGQKVLDKLKDRQRVLSNMPSTGGGSIGLSGSETTSKSGQYSSRKLQPLLSNKLGYRHN